jgi:peptidyl-prolyl cis-trans isomerase B (cyclophilin B)
MPHRRPTLLLALLALALAVPVAPVAAQDAPLGPPAATPIASPPAIPSGDGTGVRLTTEEGDIVIGLFTESSPVAVENFLNLVNAGFYVGTTFHRIDPGFVIQGGDPNGDGSGGPGYTIPDEPVVGWYRRGIVAMARTPEPDSQGSQFFVVLDDAAARSLEAANTYTILGRVLEGMDVVDAIAAGPVVEPGSDQAADPVAITATAVEQVTLPPEPTPAPTPIPGDPELEAVLPRELGGEPLEVESFNSAEVVAQFESDPATAEELSAILATAGARISDLSVAGGRVDTDQGSAMVTVLRIRDADASVLVDGLVPFVTGYTDLQTAPATIAGRELLSVTDAADPEGDPIYVDTTGDLLFLLAGDEPLLSELVGQLP